MDKILTPCQECCFCEKVNSNQTGCKLNKIQNFIDCNKIIDAYNENGNFYIVDGLCTSSRSQKWMDKYYERWEDQLQSEITINYELIILVQQTNSIQDIEETLNSISNEDVKPSFINVVVPENHFLNNIELINLIKSYNIQWKISRVHDNNQLHIATKRLLYPIYYVINAGQLLYNNFGKKLADKINDECFNLVALLDTSNNSFAVSKSIHLYLGGNYPNSIIDKMTQNKEYKVFVKEMSCLS